METPLLEKLRHKHVIFDTNLLLEASRSPEAFSGLFKAIQDAGCQPVIFPMIEFEFLQRAHQKDHREKLRLFMKELNLLRIP